MEKQTGKHHVVITGTGRSGTTFLVELLTNLGLDTGFSASDSSQLKNPIAHAGLERDIFSDDNPYIIKSPGFCDQADEALHRKDIIIDHIYVPIRNLHAAAESRRRVTRANLSQEKTNALIKRRLLQICYGKQSFKDTIYDGGILPGNSKSFLKQEDILRDKLYKLLLAGSKYHVPFTFMHYPRITKDCEYLHEKLKPLLENITYEFFYLTFARTARPDLIHTFDSQDKWEPIESDSGREAA